MISLIIIAVASTVSLFGLQQQKKQLRENLITLGEGLVQLAAKDMPKKLLADERLYLFQLLNAISANPDVQYALVVNPHNQVVAHSNPNLAGMANFHLPEDLIPYRRSNAVRISSYGKAGEEAFLFEQDITIQKHTVGVVYVSVSQKSFKDNLHKTERGFLKNALMAIAIGVAACWGLGFYFFQIISKMLTGTTLHISPKFDHKTPYGGRSRMGKMGAAVNLIVEGLSDRSSLKPGNR